jgi:hypothetical protein
MTPEALGTYDQLMRNIVTAVESSSENFTSGSVQKLASKTITPKNRPIVKQIVESAPNNDTNVESFIVDALSKAAQLTQDLEAQKETIDLKIAELREAGSFELAKNLRYAYKSLTYAVDDLRDACDLVQILIGK